MLTKQICRFFITSFFGYQWIAIGIDHDTVCAGMVGTAIQHSTSRAGRHECCAG